MKIITKSIGPIALNLMDNLIKRGDINSPIPLNANKIVTRMPLPLSYMMVPVDIKIGTIPEHANPPITKEVKTIPLFLKRIIKIKEIKAKEEIMDSKKFNFTLPMI